MAPIQDPTAAARRRIMRAAFGRWLSRGSARETALAQIRKFGPGAADSLKRQAEYRSREALRPRRGAPFLERAIGTWDATVLAPSPAAYQAAKPVARIVAWRGDGFEPRGVATGFLVSRNLLLTNHHVFPRGIDARGMWANFGYESTERGVSSGTLFALDPEYFYASDEVLDFALIGIAPVGAKSERIEEIGTIRLIEGTGKIRIGDPVNIIQHPGGGPRQYAVTNNRLTDVLEDEGFLHYETDTLQGSSGSPVQNESWELVALHHCGVPAMNGEVVLKRNGEPWDELNDSDDDIHWVANEGARVSFIVKRLKAMVMENASKQRILEDLLASTADPLRVSSPQVPKEAVGTQLTGGVDMSGTTINIHGGNISIAVSPSPAALEMTSKSASTPAVPMQAPAIATAQAAAAAIARGIVVEKAQNFDPDYETRKGYDADFLGTTVPMVRVHPDRVSEIFSVRDFQAFESDNRNVPAIDLGGLKGEEPLPIPYYHFSILVNKAYRMPMLAASNVDYRDVQRSDPRKRADFGGESWRRDPRVPAEYQLVDAQVYQPAKNFDRGHIVRREDNAWGPAGEYTEFANADSYHWTNCTPQHELFNQESPQGGDYEGRKGVWGYFERLLQQQLETGGGQATIFSGPVLSNDLPKKDFGKGPVKYPLKFWKVVVVPQSNAKKPRLLSYGYVFSQAKAIQEFGVGFEAAVELPEFKQQRASIASISALAGVIFPEVVNRSDQHKQVTKEEELVV